MVIVGVLLLSDGNVEDRISQVQFATAYTVNSWTTLPRSLGSLQIIFGLTYVFGGPANKLLLLF